MSYFSPYFSPYSIIFRYNVVRPIPNICEAIFRLPSACSNARRIRSFSCSSSFNVEQEVQICSRFISKSFADTISPAVCSIAACTVRRSSRTLPGHEWVSRALRADWSKPFTLRSSSIFACSRKNSERGMMSLLLSRSGGTVTAYSCKR